MRSDRRTKAELLAEIDTLRRRLDALEDADVRRAQVEHALRLSEAKFHSAFHRSPIAMSLSTLPEGRLVDVNEKFLALSGCTREEVLGRTSVDTGMWVDPRQRESVLASLERDGRVHDIDVSLRMLEVMGFEALTAADGREALELFRERADDMRAVLLDVNMPGMDGREAVRELWRMTPGVPVILTSGYPAPTGEAGFREEGFLQKPFRLRELRDRLRRTLEREDRADGQGAPGG